MGSPGCRGTGSLQVEEEGTLAVIDFQTLEHRVGTAVKRVRCSFQTMIQHRVGEGWALTAQSNAVEDWATAFVTLASGPAAMAAADQAALEVLVEEGAVDPTLWVPAAKVVDHRDWALPRAEQQQWLEEVRTGIMLRLKILLHFRKPTCSLPRVEHPQTEQNPKT